MSEGELNVPQFTVEQEERRGVAMIALSGELDLGSVAELRAQLDAVIGGERPRVCIDLSGLAFIDSSGLATLIRAHTAAGEAGGRLVVACAPGVVWRTLQTTGLFGMLTIAGSVDDALRELGVPAEAD